ncbi:PAS domain-containing sensor histidine kinase [Pseudalkalibacillus caeni]|nr:PAS domain S-box protein [Pseudalkalibacillus caeni]
MKDSSFVKKLDHVYEELDIYRSVMEYSSDLISLLSQEGKFVYASPASFKLLGYDPQELIDLSFYDFCHPEDLEKLRIFLTRMQRKDFATITYRTRRREGDYIWLESTAHSIHTNQTEEAKYLCISRDITDRKLAEEEIKESEEKYRLLVEHSHDTIGVLTNEGFCIYINETGKKLLGITGKGEVIGKSITNFIHPDDHRTFNKFIARNREGRFPTSEIFELQVVRPDLESKQVEMKLIPTLYKGRRTQQMIIRDITDRKKTEEMLQKAEKLSVVGQLAAGIAHEIRNPLTAIKGFTQLLNGDNENDYVDVILNELDRVETIVSDLLVLAKPQIVNLEHVDLSELLKSVATLLNTQAILHKVEIETVIFKPKSLHIDGERDKLKQVFINIVKNAIEAMPDGGKIVIKAMTAQKGKISIQIIDQGTGIPPGRLEKLGEPFYSTKEKGTGLGLMICNKIIKNHRGSLNIKSKLNEGTIVEILLPKNLKTKQM